ncbi:MAG: SNF2-related protein, partial [Gemmatimonadaceae bacterium]
MTTNALWQIDPDSKNKFEAALKSAGPPQREWAALRRDAEQLALMPAFEQLITLDMNRIEELPHQIRVAQQVLQAPMHGRAILADEVGLGKTIEASIILKELAVRGLAQRILILTPASLVTQWCEELHEKFGETFNPIEVPGFGGHVITNRASAFDQSKTAQPVEALGGVANYTSKKRTRLL